MYKLLSSGFKTDNGSIVDVVSKSNEEFLRSCFTHPFLKSQYASIRDLAHQKYTGDPSAYNEIIDSTIKLFQIAINEKYSETHDIWRTILSNKLVCITYDAGFGVGKMWAEYLGVCNSETASMCAFLPELCTKDVPLYYVSHLMKLILKRELNLSLDSPKNIEPNKKEYVRKFIQCRLLLTKAIQKETQQNKGLENHSSLLNLKMSLLILDIDHLFTSFRSYNIMKSAGFEQKIDKEQKGNICKEVISLYNEIVSLKTGVEYHVLDVVGLSGDEDIGLQLGGVLDFYMGLLPAEKMWISTFLDTASLLVDTLDMRTVFIALKVLYSGCLNEQETDRACRLFYEALPKTTDGKLDIVLIKDGLKPYLDVVSQSDEENSIYIQQVKREVFFEVDLNNADRLKSVAREVIHNIIQVCFYLEMEHGTVTALSDALDVSKQSEPKKVKKKSKKKKKKKPSVDVIHLEREIEKQQVTERDADLVKSESTESEECLVESKLAEELHSEEVIGLVNEDIDKEESSLHDDEISLDEIVPIDLSFYQSAKPEQVKTVFEDFLNRVHCYSEYCSIFDSKRDIRVKDLKRIVVAFGGSFRDGKGSHENGQIPIFNESNFSFDLKDQQNPACKRLINIAQFSYNSKVTICQRDRDYLRPYQKVQVQRAFQLLGYPAIS